MSRKNGFTLVELMVVIVIIGVLAAVAIPKMMAAVNKARASEGPQILGTISNLQAAYTGETGSSLVLAINATGAPVTLPNAAYDNWDALGFDLVPGSRWYNYESTGTAATPVLAIGALGRDFVATATTRADFGRGAVFAAPQILTIDQDEERLINSAAPVAGVGMAQLLPNWR